jgi:hypothetical protein
MFWNKTGLRNLRFFAHGLLSRLGICIFVQREEGTTMSIFKTDDQKFRDLIVYVASQTMDDPEFASTKMEKALWHIDFRCFKHNGSPATGARYVKFRHGPVPICYKSILQQMINERLVAEAPCEIGGNSAKKVVALNTPDLSRFTADEISIADKVLSEFRRMTARQISALSHDHIGYKSVGEMQTIPYGTALFTQNTRALGPKDIEYGLSVLDRM